MIVIASQMCEQEVGDGTNLVLILAGNFFVLNRGVATGTIMELVNPFFDDSI